MEATVRTNCAPGSRLAPLVAAPTSVARMSRRSGVKKSALGGQQVSSTRLGSVVLDTDDPAGTTCWPLTWNFTVLQAVW